MGETVYDRNGNEIGYMRDSSDGAVYDGPSIGKPVIPEVADAPNIAIWVVVVASVASIVFTPIASFLIFVNGWFIQFALHEVLKWGRIRHPQKITNIIVIAGTVILFVGFCLVATILLSLSK